MNQPESEYMPTLAEVTRYMETWRKTMEAIPGATSLTLTCHPRATGMVFRAMIWGGEDYVNYQASSPEEVISLLTDERDPGRRARQMREAAQAMLDRAAELEAAV